jgi:curli biogenesis system outer membrane secretion channel CsgG
LSQPHLIARVRPVTLAALAVPVVALLAACGTKTVSGAEIEQKASRAIEQQTGVKNVSVKCPPKVEAKAGTKAKCKLSAPGQQSLDLLITMKDDKGNFHYVTQRARK